MNRKSSDPIVAMTVVFLLFITKMYVENSESQMKFRTMNPMEINRMKIIYIVPAYAYPDSRRPEHSDAMQIEDATDFYRQSRFLC
jgi:hypothetical protein